MLNIFDKFEKIDDFKTKKYFEEVLVSYNNKNYRSAIVMLYSVVVFDILKKLNELAEIYDQEWAEKILSIINDKRKKNPKDPNWENELIDELKKQNEFLSLSIIEELSHLKEIRNQCAHPSIDENDELFTPTRSVAEALIERMLNEILTIPAMFTKKITDYITEQIAKVSNYPDYGWNNQYDLASAFSKYFIRMNDEVFKKVFKDMWKLTFFTDNEDCDKNRFANTVFIEIMMNQRHTLILELLWSEPNYFNKISNKDKIIMYLTVLIYRNDYLFSLMDKISINYMKIAMENLPETQIFCSYLYDSEDEYFNNLLENDLLHNKQYLDCIIEFYFTNEKLSKDKFRKCIIDIFLKSSDFDDADFRFENLILPISDELSKNDLLYLIKKSEHNDQISGRYKTMNKFNKVRLCSLIKKAEISLLDTQNAKKFYELYKNFLNLKP